MEFQEVVKIVEDECAAENFSIQDISKNEAYFVIHTCYVPEKIRALTDGGDIGFGNVPFSTREAEHIQEEQVRKRFKRIALTVKENAVL